MVDTLVWVTGGSAGIGAALIQAVPYDDARVFDISRSGGTVGAEHVAADLSDPASWEDVAAHFAAQLDDFGGDRAVLIHNAGTLEPLGFAGEVDSEAYRRSVMLNAGAPQAIGDAFLAAVAASGFGGQAVVVQLSSGAATTPSAGWSSYCAGKAALQMWVRCVGQEQQRRESRVTVLAVAPGVVATGMQERIRRASPHDFPDVERFQQLHARDELRDPAAVARDLWALLETDVDNGAVLDLRSR
jgi:benzil reductase ((S)-benzoin forming)